MTKPVLNGGESDDRMIGGPQFVAEFQQLLLDGVGLLGLQALGKPAGTSPQLGKMPDIGANYEIFIGEITDGRLETLSRKSWLNQWLQIPCRNPSVGRFQ